MAWGDVGCTVGTGFCVGIVEDLVVVNWRDRPSVEAVERVAALLDVVIDRFGKVAFLVGTDKSTPPADGPARDAFSTVMSKRAKSIKASVLVIEGTGLKSAAIRAVVTAITLLGNVDPVPQVCASVEEGAEILAGVLDVDDAQAIVAVADRVKQHERIAT